MSKRNDLEFITSVGTVIASDVNDGNVIFYGTTNLSTSLTSSIQKTEVRAGQGNALLYNHYHDRDLQLTIERPTFDLNYLALASGKDIEHTEYPTLFTEDCVVFDDAGNYTLKNVPLGDVTVVLPNNLTVVVTADVTKQITVPQARGMTVKIFYKTLRQVDMVSMDTQTPPKVVDIVIINEIRDQSQAVVKRMHIHIPRFQCDGNYSLNMTPDSVANESITGQALATTGEVCQANMQLGEFIFEYVREDALVSVADIVAEPARIEFQANPAENQTADIAVKGLRGLGLTPVDITENCVFALASNPVPSAGISVSPTGVITVAQEAEAGDSATVKITYEVDGMVFEDVVEVTVA